MIFEIPKNQEQKVHNWIINYKCKKKNKPTAIGGRCSFVFTPTGLGIFAKVTCAEKN